MRTYSPWKHLASMPAVLIDYVDLPSGHAWWSPAHQVILMARGLTSSQRRCALAHELAHIDLGHVGVDDYPDADRQDGRLHADADRLAARRLIDIHRLADIATAYPDDPHRVAEELDVDYETLAARVRWLHPAERHYLRRRLEGRGDSA